MTPPFLLKVGGLHTIDADLPAFRPTHLIGILDPTMAEPQAYRHASATRARLLLRFFDSEVGGLGGPRAEDVGAMLRFLAGFDAGAGATRLYLHCHAGASRSTAAAYLALLHRHGWDRAEAAFAELLRVTNKPWPNRRIVELADAELGAGGRLLAPLDAYRSVHRYRLEAYVRLHRRRARRDPEHGVRLGIGRWRPMRLPPEA